MSSILKALKRLEEERTGKSVPAGGQYVAPPRGRRPRSRLLLAGWAAVALLLASGGYLWWAGREARPPQLTVSAIQPSPPAPVATGPAPAVVPVSQSAVAPVAAAPRQVASSQPAAPLAAPSKTVPSTRKPAAAPAAVPATRPIPPPPAALSPAPVEQVQVERREIPAPGEQWAAPHLVVSEVLPDGGGGRMAIVNGLPVMEGTMVENALVRTIATDRVVFVVDGKTVAVPVGKGR